MRRVALAILGLVLLTGALTVVLAPAVVPGTGSLDPAFASILFVGLGGYWALGGLIVLRADGHTVGWLFAISAALLSSVFACWAASSVAGTLDPRGTADAWFVLVGSLLFPPALVLALPAVMMVFPTGRLPGPRWRWPAGLLAALVVAQTIATLLRPGSMSGDMLSPLDPWTSSLPAFVIDFLFALTGLGALWVPFGLALGIITIVVRFRRSRGDERAQLKWFLAAAIPAAILVPLSLSDVGATVPGIDAISAASLPLAALAVAIAILRYRLYEIDRVISRTIAYGLVTGVLLAMYGVLILLLQGPLGRVTGGETVTVALSTLIVAALFQPVRRRVQEAVDRRFHRARFDAEQTALGFSGRLRDEVDIATVTTDLRATVHGAIRPASFGLWLRTSARSVTAASNRDAS